MPADAGSGRRIGRQDVFDLRKATDRAADAADVQRTLKRPPELPQLLISSAASLLESGAVFVLRLGVLVSG
jgi:hypothetical protein